MEYVIMTDYLDRACLSTVTTISCKTYLPIILTILTFGKSDRPKSVERVLPNQFTSKEVPRLSIHPLSSGVPKGYFEFPVQNEG